MNLNLGLRAPCHHITLHIKIHEYTKILNSQLSYVKLGLTGIFKVYENLKMEISRKKLMNIFSIQQTISNGDIKAFLGQSNMQNIVMFCAD